MTHTRSYPVIATAALIAKWRAEAKRHEAAAEEPDMDPQEYTHHDECHRVYSKCAEELAGIAVAQQAVDCGEMVRVAKMAKAAAEMELGLAAYPDFSPRDMLDAANAALSTVPSTHYERPTVIGRVTGREYEGDQVSGMPWAICHACGLKDYPCANPDCPKKAFAISSTDPRCTCAAIVNPNIPHARSCPLSLSRPHSNTAAD